MAENDWDGWKLMIDRLGGRIQIVGDDLFVTNTRIIKEGIEDELDEVGVFNGKDVFYNSLPIPWRLTPVSVGTFCQRKVGYPST